MIWTEIDLYTVNLLTAATDLDNLRTNIEYLHTTNYAEYHHPGTGANYTVSGNLGQDIDAVFNLSLTTYGGLVMACFYGQWTLDTAGNSIRTNIIRTDTVSHLGVNLYNDYHMEIQATAATGQGRGWVQVFDNVPAGTHQFRAVWGSGSAAVIGTLFAAYRPYMSVFEV